MFVMSDRREENRYSVELQTMSEWSIYGTGANGQGTKGRAVGYFDGKVSMLFCGIVVCGVSWLDGVGRCRVLIDNLTLVSGNLTRGWYWLFSFPYSMCYSLGNFSRRIRRWTECVIGTRNTSFRGTGDTSALASHQADGERYHYSYLLPHSFLACSYLASLSICRTREAR